MCLIARNPPHLGPKVRCITGCNGAGAFDDVVTWGSPKKMGPSCGESQCFALESCPTDTGSVADGSGKHCHCSFGP